MTSAGVGDVSRGKMTLAGEDDVSRGKMTLAGVNDRLSGGWAGKDTDRGDVRPDEGADGDDISNTVLLPPPDRV